MNRDKINPHSCLSIIAVCCLQHLTPVFVYFREHRWKKHALSDQSKSSLWNAFKDTSRQQVKRMLSRACILVRFSWFGPEQTVWFEKEPKRLKIATMYHFLPLVRTKASELSDFPGVNTPQVIGSFINLFDSFKWLFHAGVKWYFMNGPVNHLACVEVDHHHQTDRCVTSKYNKSHRACLHLVISCVFADRMSI